MISDSLYHLFIFSGLAFAFAIINIAVGIQKNSEKTYLFFGIISLCVGVYYLLFPLIDKSVTSGISARIGLAFFIVAFAIFPWFIKYYASYKSNVFPWALSIGMGLALFLFLITPDNEAQLWNIIAHIVLVGIIAFGFLAMYHQFKHGNERSAFFLLAALIPFLLLSIDDIIYVHFNDYYFFDLPEQILPFDYFFIFFMVIMGVKLASDMYQKLLLEQRLAYREKRWRNLLEKVELIVVGISRDGAVNYVNPYFLKLCGYKEREVIYKNWFLNFLPQSVGRDVYKVFQNNIGKDHHPYHKNPILTKDGKELMIAWSNVVLEDDDSKRTGTLSIGVNITVQEEAFEEIEMLKRKLELENIFLKSELGKVMSPDKIIGDSDAIQYVLQRASQVAEMDTTVLLEGETGVGKELIANYIQANSKISDKPYVKVNCSAIPATLLESELFGHDKGAFTGADKNKKGLVEMADGGTLFLDEIGEFPLELQPKLLRFLQDGEFKPLGNESGKVAHVRIIAATNRELLKEVQKGRFRDDLYYRISVYPITVPALRNRPEDIPGLIDVFVKQYSHKHGKSIKKISKVAMEELCNYSWPGNIRELQNIIERAIIISNSDTIKHKDIASLPGDIEKPEVSKEYRIDTLQNAERAHIIRALDKTEWKVHGKTGAAELLGINPNTLRSRMKKLDIYKS